VHVSTGYDLFAGLAIYEKTNTLYAIARESSSGDCYIIEVDTVVPQSTKKIAKLPKLGNGLAINQRNGHLWATAEGYFIPFEGAVYEIVPSNGTVFTRVSDSFADDGAYMNQREAVLIVSQVIGSEVMQIDAETSMILEENRAPSSVGMLDDYCLSTNGTILYGADYEHGECVSPHACGCGCGCGWVWVCVGEGGRGLLPHSPPPSPCIGMPALYWPTCACVWEKVTTVVLTPCVSVCVCVCLCLCVCVSVCLCACVSVWMCSRIPTGNIVSFRLDGKGTTATTLASKLSNPTSARWGCGGAFPETSLFVTEGNTLLGKTANRMVLELPNVRPASEV